MYVIFFHEERLDIGLRAISLRENLRDLIIKYFATVLAIDKVH